MEFDTRGQMVGTPLVIGVIVMLATIAFGGIIFSEIQSTAEEQADDDCADTLSVGENIAALTGQTGGDVFPLIILVVLLSVFGAILAVLRMWG